MKLLNYISQLIIPIFILFVIIYGYYKKIKVYDSFISGAKEGLNVIIKIFPYLVAIFIVVKSFQVSGAFNFIKDIISPLFLYLNIPIEVLSISIIKPLSGSASTAIFTDIIKTTGPDSLATRISAVIMGSAETTFYILAIYLGAVGIKKTKYLIGVCIISDIIGIIISITIVKLLFQ